MGFKSKLFSGLGSHFGLWTHSSEGIEGLVPQLCPGGISPHPKIRHPHTPDIKYSQWGVINIWGCGGVEYLGEGLMYSHRYRYM